MTRSYHFGAGPAMLPEPVLRQAQTDLLEWQHSGMSILEVGHRTPEFRCLLEQAEATLRRLLAIPDYFHVLFLSGPARMLFSMIPMNLLAEGESADYLSTGIWSEMAYQEAHKLKLANRVASGESSGFRTIPSPTSWKVSAKARYFYYTPNETVNGLYCPRSLITKKVTNKPVIADMTSCLLAEPIHIDDYDLIFAGAQKNIANAGLTLVIVRDELVKTITNPMIPTVMDFRTHIEHRSLYTTPATFNCYLAGQMFTWIEQQGGVDALYQINQEKARKLYDYIDSSSFYSAPVDKSYRSFLNLCFHLGDSSLENLFLEEAEKRHLLALKGHRLVGGLRASLYNAMPIEGVDCLIDFMRDFERGRRV
jgi:phosphoserine aminotransferase